MDEGSVENNKFSFSFYDKLIHIDENIQATVKPVLNQILENRVTIKELHIEYAIKFSEIINSYQNRLDDIKCSYEKLMSELHEKEKNILQISAELLQNKNN